MNHGEASTYSYYKCRCDECVTAESEYRKQRYKDGGDAVRKQKIKAALTWRTRNPERAKETNRESQARTRLRHPKRIAARKAMAAEIASGAIIRPNVCERCNENVFTEASHDDYNEPLKVEWLCRPCHMKKDRRIK